MATATVNPPAKNELPKGAAKAIADNAKPHETKSEKFIRLANRRVNKALKMLSYVRNLSARNTYEYSETQAAKLVAVLAKSVKDIESAFSGASESKDSFSL